MKARYESRFVRAVDPDRPRGVWIRCTTIQRPGAPPVTSLWCTLWDPRHPAPRTVKATPGEGDHLRGFAQAGTSRATWALSIDADTAPVRHLPRPLYRAPLPRTKLQSPVPAGRVSGTVGADGIALELDGWLGMTGHNWGVRHAERWIWVHGIGFEGIPDAWLDLAVGRVTIGPLITPWIANGVLHVGGRRRTIRGRACVDAQPGWAAVRLGTLTVTATASPDETVAWVYADPCGGEHHVLNCSISTVEVDWGETSLRTSHCGVYELGMRDQDHGLRVAPFPDP